MGKNSTASALKEPISAVTPSSGRKTSTSSGLIARQNATKSATSSQVHDNMTSSSNEVVLKSGWMTKRSQLKSIFSFTNYRERYFQLTKSALVYFDTAPPITQGSSHSGKNKRGKRNFTRYLDFQYRYNIFYGRILILTNIFLI